MLLLLDAFYLTSVLRTEIYLCLFLYFLCLLSIYFGRHSKGVNAGQRDAVESRTLLVRIA